MLKQRSTEDRVWLFLSLESDTIAYRMDLTLSSLKIKQFWHYLSYNASLRLERLAMRKSCNKLIYVLPMLLGLGFAYADQCPDPATVAGWLVGNQAQNGWHLYNPNAVKSLAAFDHVEWSSNIGGNVPPGLIGCAYTAAPGQLPWVFVVKPFAGTTAPSGLNWSPLASYFGCVSTNARDTSSCAWT